MCIKLVTDYPQKLSADNNHIFNMPFSVYRKKKISISH